MHTAERCFHNKRKHPPPPLQQYWLGLATALSSWPNFEWVASRMPQLPMVAAPPPPPPATGTVDPPVLPPDSYTNWGALLLTNGTSLVEPNNAVSPPELCGVGNYSQVTNVTWPWADASCELQLPFMCRVTRGWTAD